MMRRFSDPFRGFVIACLTIALLVIGFAHRMPTMAEAGLQSYVAAGGSVAALCHDGDETPQIQTAKCPVCHLTAQCLLPEAGIGLRPSTMDQFRKFGMSVVAFVESPASRANLMYSMSY